MTPTGPDADLLANTRLVLGERETRDRRWWSAALDCFHPGATVNVAWFHGAAAEFVSGSRAQAESGTPTAHRVSPPTVHLGGDRAIVFLPVVICARMVIDGVEADLESCGSIVYRTERRAGSWRIAALDCVYETDRLTPAIPGTTVVTPPDELTRLRPATRMLAWTFARRGIAIRDDVLGADRPDEVDAFQRRVFAWAGLPAPDQEK